MKRMLIVWRMIDEEIDDTGVIEYDNNIKEVQFFYSKN
jgi:hypothetical protein